MGMREIAPYGVRMPADLKKRIEREAKAAGRSMNTEVVARLTASFSSSQQQQQFAYGAAGYMPNDITDAERQMLEAFRKLSAEHQLALLTLLR